MLKDISDIWRKALTKKKKKGITFLIGKKLLYCSEIPEALVSLLYVKYNFGYRCRDLEEKSVGFIQ